MQSILHTFGLGLAVSAAMLIATPLAHAQVVGPIGADTYVGDPFGNAVKDPFGDCIRTLDGGRFPECGVALVPPRPTPVVETLTLGADAFFDFDKSTLKPAGQESLDRLYEDLQRTQDVQDILVVGHTDSVGTEQYNQGLSERRAATVESYLEEKGLNVNIIRSRGEGEANPIATNETAQGRAKNRRVEVTVTAEPPSGVTIQQ